MGWWLYLPLCLSRFIYWTLPMYWEVHLLFVFLYLTNVSLFTVIYNWWIILLHNIWNIMQWSVVISGESLFKTPNCNNLLSVHYINIEWFPFICTQSHCLFNIVSWQHIDFQMLQDPTTATILYPGKWSTGPMLSETILSEPTTYTWTKCSANSWYNPGT